MRSTFQKLLSHAEIWSSFSFFFPRASKTKGIQPEDLHNEVEMDSFIYNTTRNGDLYSSDISLCHIFVCKVFKAAGIFGNLKDDFQCGDLSVNDMYRLNIYEKTDIRPESCKKADPENPLCQVLGKYTLRLDNQPGQGSRFNYANLYKDFGSNCSSLAPEYEILPGC